MGSPVCVWRAKWSNTSGTVANDSLNCEGISTKSRGTAVPDNVLYLQSESMPWRACPNSWKSVQTSSQVMRVG